MIDRSEQTAARVAGVSFILSMMIVVFGNYVLLNPLIVPRDAAATAHDILAHPTQFRLALTCFLVYSANTVVLLSALYVIFKPINQGLALLGGLFRLIFAMLWLLSSVSMLNALRLATGAGYLQVFEPNRLQALARLSIASTF